MPRVTFARSCCGAGPDEHGALLCRILIFVVVRQYVLDWYCDETT